MATQPVTILVQRVRTERIKAAIEVDMSDFAEWSEGDDRPQGVLMAEYLAAGRDWPTNVEIAADHSLDQWRSVDDGEYSVVPAP